MSDYGRDDTGKDTSADGTFLPSALAEEAVLGIKRDVDWSRYDLNGDVPLIASWYCTRPKVRKKTLESPIVFGATTRV